MTDPTPTDKYRGQTLRGSDNDWSRMRLAAGLSITELAKRSGLARSVVGLIDQGRLVPSPEEAMALARATQPETAA